MENYYVTSIQAIGIHAVYMDILAFLFLSSVTQSRIADRYLTEPWQYTAMFSTSPSRHVKSVQTAFRIVEIIQKQDGATIKELTDHLEISKSTIHNYMSTLESLGYVVNRGGTYRVGLRFLTHGMAARNGLDIGKVVGSALTEVADEIDQTAWWITEEIGRGIFVDTSVPEGGQVIFGRVGKRSYLHTHGPGKAILAQQSNDHVQQVLDYHGLPEYTSETVTDRDVLLDQLEQIREQGYAYTDGEAALGVQSIGVAFQDAHGQSHAIGVFGYSHDFGGEILDSDIPSLLQLVASDIVDSLSMEGSNR